MQIKCLPRNLYKFYAWSRSQECLDTHRKRIEASVRHWESLRAEGVSEAKCAEFVGISRATFFRRRACLKALAGGVTPPSKAPKRRNKPHWGEREKQLVLEVRRANPTYGKFKIAVILKRDHGLEISESTVGRILLLLRKKRLITRSRTSRIKRNRNFSKGHAKRWRYKDYNEMELGERIQVDHMTVSKNGITVKHFQAWERKSKHIHAAIYSNAKATSAKKFLSELVETAPYKILSIQVDGGSEFMAEFETECERLNIHLDVLPPKRPKYNGGVERGNRTFREEFYEDRRVLFGSISALRFDLKKALEKYNTYRPHSALNGKTPMQYIRIIDQAGAA